METETHRDRGFGRSAIRRHKPALSAQELSLLADRIETEMLNPSRGDLASYGGGLLKNTLARDRHGRTMSLDEALCQERIDPVAINDALHNHLAALDVAVGYLQDAGWQILEPDKRGRD